MRILAFDQSTRVSGYSVFDNNDYVESGFIDLHQIIDTDDRSKQMGILLCGKITDANPDVIIIEEVQCQSNVDTVKKLSRIQGMIIGFAAANNIQTHIIEPSRWRSQLGFTQGRGVKRAELKQQSIDYVKEHFRLNVTEDEAEAICQNVAAQKILMI